MPKQGKYAAARRRVQLRGPRGRVKRQAQTIDFDQLGDFLLVRYALTARRDLPQEARESGQRFLQELADRLPAGGPVDGEEVVDDLFSAVNARVPWQFFWQVSVNWEVLRRFLGRELPAIPLDRRLTVTTLPTQAELDHRLVGLLARRVARATTLNQALPVAVLDRLAAGIATELMTGDRVNWERVDHLLSPLGFPLDPGLDEGSRDWLSRLRGLRFPGK